MPHIAMKLILAHCKKAAIIALTIIVFIFLCSFAKADIRNKNFSKRIRNSIAISFDYNSDYNSNQTDLDIHFKHIGPKKLHELQFFHRIINSSTSTIPLRATKNLYNFELSNKLILSNIELFYLSSFLEFEYDDLSRDYYKFINTVGIGFFLYEDKKRNDLAVFDMNIGISQTGGNDRLLVFNPTLLIKIKITDNLYINQNSYIVIDQQGSYSKNYKESITTYLTYKISKHISIRFNHNFERDFYFYQNSSKTKSEYRNRIKRSFLIGIKYNFN
ncbi:hypothetical protein N9C35_02430 [Flavobacteriaceae bacterium]|nr:hypothetical protein [Flavobacteriaceae bacterium]